jgi:hypothetical protein
MRRGQSKETIMREEKETTTQYNITVRNKPGELAKLTKFLSDEAVRVSALRVANSGDKASIQFSTVDDCDLREGLRRTGLHVDAE